MATQEPSDLLPAGVTGLCLGLRKGPATKTGAPSGLGAMAGWKQGNMLRRPDPGAFLSPPATVAVPTCTNVTRLAAEGGGQLWAGGGCLPEVGWSGPGCQAHVPQPPGPERTAEGLFPAKRRTQRNRATDPGTRVQPSAVLLTRPEPPTVDCWGRKTPGETPLGKTRSETEREGENAASKEA